MRSRFAAFSACANCVPSGRGRTDAPAARRSKQLAGVVVLAARLHLDDFEPDSGKGGGDEDAGECHTARRNQPRSPLRGSAPLRGAFGRV